MFEGCRNLESLDVSGFDTSNGYYFDSMFAGCASLAQLPGVELWDMSLGRDFQSMFERCPKLSLDCSAWDVSGLVKSSKDNPMKDFSKGSAGVIAPAR